MKTFLLVFRRKSKNFPDISKKELKKEDFLATSENWFPAEKIPPIKTIKFIGKTLHSAVKKEKGNNVYLKTRKFFRQDRVFESASCKLAKRSAIHNICFARKQRLCRHEVCES